MKLLFGAHCASLLTFTGSLSARASTIDPPPISGVNTAGLVRVNCLSNLEALLNLAANGIEITGLLIGTVMLLRAMTSTHSGRRRWKVAFVGLVFVAAGLATPAAINWIVATARDANLFA